MMGLTIAGSVALAWSPAAKAATAASDLGVGAAVIAKCTITTASIAFGDYDPVVANASTNLDGTGTVTVACTKGATASIGLNLGANATGSMRQMSDGSSGRLTYELFSDSDRSTVWGNAAGSWVTPVAAPSKAARDFTVYGRVAGNQDVAAGTYTDTVVATVNF
jgi:spore coat protein U-like protein